MKFTRLLTKPDLPVGDQIEWKTVDVIVSGKGAVIFEQKGVEVPAQWSQNASTVLAQKYFRKAGVPSKVSDGGLFRAGGADVPDWLRPRVPLNRATFGGETSARQVFHRLAGCWTYWGWRIGLFEGPYVLTADDLALAEESARVFYDELYFMLATQVGAPNSPQWFNTGLYWAYGITGPDSGQWSCDDDGVPHRVHSTYERPQPHACFLTPTCDDLVNEGGIMDTWVREARIFKHGSGSGINVSAWRSRGEKLSGGGVASGVMSWLRIGDSAAGAIQSGGTTRRAAKMVCMDVDHPEVEAFIDWKVREEAKAASMFVGSQVLRNIQDFGSGQTNGRIDVPDAAVDRLGAGFPAEVFGVGWEEEAIASVDGQNSNNSVRVRDAFIRAVEEDGDWNLTARTSGEVVKTVRASNLWDRMSRAAWASADPGLIFHDTVNRWNTCAADGEIRTTNPCSEFHHLDGSACDLASVRATAFLRDDGSIDLDKFEHACRLWTVALDVSVSMASFPAKEFAEAAWQYRTLGLGYCDLGGLLMRLAIPYDSDEGRELGAGLTALMSGAAYRTSAEMAAELGPFPRWSENEVSFRRVMASHRAALTSGRPRQISCRRLNDRCIGLYDRCVKVWDEVVAAPSFRNAQVTLLAPTGTISFVMDVDTTGVEPDFALIKHKELAGGGSMEIVNRAVPEALRRLGYGEGVVAGIEAHLAREKTLVGCSLLRLGHDAVFACAGDISPAGHVAMVAAVQPFLSGGVSKTINLPRTATVEDVSRVLLLAYRMGLKSVSLYRDGSKLTQPLRSAVAAAVPAPSDHGEILADVLQAVAVEAARPLARGEREYLPWRRDRVWKQKVKIGQHGQTVFLDVSEYPDGRPGEIFLEISNQGSTLRALADCVAIAVSIGLQYGVPIEKYVDKFVGTKFEPDGYVEGHDRIRFVSSIADYIGRELGIAYCGRDDMADAPAPIDEAVERIAAVSERLDADWVSKRTAELSPALAAHSSQTPPRAVLTGDTCNYCGALLQRDGTCRKCPNCHWTEGCGG